MYQTHNVYQIYKIESFILVLLMSSRMFRLEAKFSKLVCQQLHFFVKICSSKLRRHNFRFHIKVLFWMDREHCSTGGSNFIYDIMKIEDWKRLEIVTFSIFPILLFFVCFGFEVKSVMSTIQCFLYPGVKRTQAWVTSQSYSKLRPKLGMCFPIFCSKVPLLI